jgi:hypothetical protein
LPSEVSVIDPQSPPSAPANAKQTDGLLQLNDNSILYPPLAASPAVAPAIVTVAAAAALISGRKIDMCISSYTG